MPETSFNDLDKPVILYDGVCNFCNAIVNFIISKDTEKVFLFSPLQSREARALLRSRDMSFVGLKTVYLVDGADVYQRSAAVFKMFRRLSLPWKLFSVCSILPLFITDALYKLVARYRYKWFGKVHEMVQPDEKLKERFLTVK